MTHLFVLDVVLVLLQTCVLLALDNLVVTVVISQFVMESCQIPQVLVLDEVLVLLQILALVVLIHGLDLNVRFHFVLGLLRMTLKMCAQDVDHVLLLIFVLDVMQDGVDQCVNLQSVTDTLQMIHQTFVQMDVVHVLILILAPIALLDGVDLVVKIQSVTD